MLELLGVITNPLIALGLVVGGALGLALAYALHMLFPLQDLLLVQALLVAVGCILGLIIGSRAEARWGGK